MDPNEPLPGRDRWITDPDLFPDELPEGVTKDAKAWYAFERVFRDGRKVVQWFKRNSGPVVDGKPQDPVFTEQTTVVPSVRKEWEQAQKEDAKPDPTVSAPPTQPNIVSRNPDGTLATQPNPNYTPPGSEAASPAQQNEAALNNERSWHEQQGHGRLTHAEYATQQRQAQADARAATERNQPTTVATNTTEPFIVERMPDGSLRTTKNPNYRGPVPEKGTNLTVKGGDGKTYIIPVDAQGNIGQPRDSGIPGEPPKPEPDKYSTIHTDEKTGESMGLTRGANPHWEVIPVQGQAAKPTTRAPSLPQFIVGASQDALRTAYDDIQAAVDRGERTPAWGENRRKEILETARLTVQEAQLHENSRQFNQGQAESLATTKLNYGQGALKFALQSALQINGRLKPGSSAGANMFRDLFLFQMQMARDSGIYGITPGGGQSSVGQGMPGAPTRAGNPQTRPPITAGDTEAHAVSADERAANLAAGLEGNGAPREYTPAGSPGAVVPPPTTGAPPPPTALPTTADAPAPVSNVPPSPSAPRAPSPISSAPPPPLTTPTQAPGSGPTIRVADPWGNEFDLTQQQIDNRPPNSPPLHPAPSAVTPQSTGAPRAMTPPADTFPALEAFRMPLTPQPQIDPLAASNPPDPMMSPAIQAARIAATPPWLLPPDQLENLVRQHGEDVVFGYPGMPRTGAA